MRLSQNKIKKRAQGVCSSARRPWVQSPVQKKKKLFLAFLLWLFSSYPQCIINVWHCKTWNQYLVQIFSSYLSFLKPLITVIITKLWTIYTVPHRLACVNSIFISLWSRNYHPHIKNEARESGQAVMYPKTCLMIGKAVIRYINDNRKAPQSACQMLQGPNFNSTNPHLTYSPALTTSGLSSRCYHERLKSLLTKQCLKCISPIKQISQERACEKHSDMTA